jgi:TPR repeat protein
MTNKNLCSRCLTESNSAEFCDNCGFDLILGPGKKKYEGDVKLAEQLYQQNKYDEAEKLTLSLIEMKVPAAMLLDAIYKVKIPEVESNEKYPEVLLSIEKDNLDKTFTNLEDYSQYKLFLGTYFAQMGSIKAISALKESLKFGQSFAALELAVFNWIHRKNSEHTIYYLDYYLQKKDLSSIKPFLAGNILSLYGDSFKIEQNYEKAFYHYEKGAKLGNYDCQVALCEFYVNGVGVKPSMKEAMNWANMAYENPEKEPREKWRNNIE